MTTGAVRSRSASGEASPRNAGQRAEGGTGQVVSHVRDLIERGALKPGDRLPAERDLATQIGVSRPTIRAGLRTLAAMLIAKITGYILQTTGSYVPIFFMAAFAYLIALAVIQLLVPQLKPVELN